MTLSTTVRLRAVLPPFQSNNVVGDMVEKLYNELASELQNLRAPTTFEMRLDGFGLLAFSDNEQAAIRDGLRVRVEAADVGQVKVLLADLITTGHPITRPTRSPVTTAVQGLVLKIVPKARHQRPTEAVSRRDVYHPTHRLRSH